MSTPRFYSWDDDGSPGRALTGNLQNRLKQILVPCLVTGYGSKPGAGWTVGHEHANGFSLINADGNVVNFVSELPAMGKYPAMYHGVIHIYAAESITDSSSAIIDGANLCSGTYRKGEIEPTTYPRHVLGRASELFANGLSELQWTLCADNSTFTLSVTRSDATAVPTWRTLTLYAGKSSTDVPISGNFVVLGGGIANYNSIADAEAFSSGYSAPTNLSTGLANSIVVGAQPYMAAGAAFSPVLTASVIPSRINLQQPRIVYGSSFVGRLRGVVYDDVIRSIYGWQVALKALGFSGGDFNDRGVPALIDGYSYAYAYSSTGSSMLTDNPAFW